MTNEWNGNKYQFQLPHVVSAPQTLPEVKVVHILVDETERVRLCRVHPHERYYLHASVAKDAVHVDNSNIIFS